MTIARATAFLLWASVMLVLVGGFLYLLGVLL